MAKEIELRGIVGVDITARNLSDELTRAAGADVVLLVNSPGGLFFAGIEIHNLIRAYKGNIDVLITGMAASAASYFILPARKISAYDNSTYMIHNARNLAIGDKHVMLKSHSVLAGMDNIMANGYMKRSGKPVGSLKSLMDAETFYFGDDMRAAGFIDEIIEAPDDSANAHDKDSAVAVASATIESCFDSLRATEAANQDFQRATAHIDTVGLFLADSKDDKPNTTIDPAVAGKVKTKEEAKMTFKEFLDANPSARAEYDAAIATARADGEKGARDELAAIVAKVEPYLKSKDYSATVKEHAVKAITGEGHIATVETLVAVEDQAAEVAKEAAALLEQQNEETGATGADGVDAKAQAEFDDRKKRLGGK